MYIVMDRFVCVCVCVLDVMEFLESRFTFNEFFYYTYLVVCLLLLMPVSS